MGRSKVIAWVVGGAAAMAAAAVVVSVVAAVTQNELREDQPLPAPQNGTVTGVITPAEQVASLSLISRQTGASAEVSAFDQASGEFSFVDLSGDATYDVVITTADGRSIEGIDLSFVDARLLRLADLRREQLGVPAEEPQEFTQADADAILRYVQELQDFMDLRRPLYVAGHGQRATLLVETMRTREFHESDGNIVWRIELWYFGRHGGGWARVDNQNRLLRRVKASPAKWNEIQVEYWPELSVFIAADGTSEPITFDIPAEVDPSRGRPADTPPELETEVHILGASEVTGEEAPMELGQPSGPGD